MLKHKYAFNAFGTQWQIDSESELSEEIIRAVQKRISLFDKTYSRFRSDSLVSEVSIKAGTYAFPSDSVKLFQFYRILYKLTDGKVTPLIGSLISQAGYDASYSFKKQALQNVPEWDDVMKWDKNVLTTSMPVLLDVGAAGKGYAVDEIAAILDKYSISEYVVDASGDLRHKGMSKNKVGLEHPFDTTKVIGVVEVENKSMCASASNRRVWGEGMHHILDPIELSPTKEVVATWVVADEAMIADGLATALFFTEPSVLKKKFVFDFVRMKADGSVEFSSLFEGKLF